MGYAWDDTKKDECYRMYIVENKTIDEIMEYYSGQHFTPSNRAFQAHFKRWGFPAKHRPANRGSDLAARIRELWEVNTGNKQMMVILRAEGWDVKERELTKLRKDNGLLLRERNRDGNGSKKRKRKGANAEEDQENGNIDVTEPVSKRAKSPSPLQQLPPEVLAKRQARQDRLLAESAQRLKDGTRRRRTKGWSTLPADPQGPPRYPSELTMEENKDILGLDRSMYREMRDIFESICRANNIIKKTLCSAETWKGAKDELISQMPHLQAVFWGPNSVTLDQAREPMAFDLICMDVTKKLRDIGTRIKISDAKQILALTPHEAREIRAAFDAVLKGDHFVSKLEVPREHWEGLKGKWINESPVLQEKLSSGNEDPQYEAKLRSLESIACDVQKRNRDQQTKADPTFKSVRKNTVPAAQTSIRPQDSSPTTAQMPDTAFSMAQSMPHNSTPISPTTSLAFPNTGQQPLHRYSLIDPSPIPPPQANNNIAHVASRALATNTNTNTDIDTGTIPDNDTNPPPPPQLSPDFSTFQIDPTLLSAASLPPQQPQQPQQSSSLEPPEQTTPPPPTTTNSTPIYFRLSPTSSIIYRSTHPKIWLSTLTPPYTLSTLLTHALSKTKAPGATVAKIEGIEMESNVDKVMKGMGHGWAIDEDDELEAYLEMVRERGGKGKATFVVEIV